MVLTISPESEALAIRIALGHAARRWPHANKVTMPEVMAEINAMKKRLRRVSSTANKEGKDD